MTDKGEITARQDLLPQTQSVITASDTNVRHVAETEVQDKSSDSEDNEFIYLRN
jgi:hypothetical protein